MKPRAVIVDRDGTLASLHNAPLTRDKGAWGEYNAALPFDAPVPQVVALLHAIRPGVTIIMVSGRMEGDHPGDRRRRFQMQDWIAKHRIPVDCLHMRAGGDTRRDSIVKEEILISRILPEFEPVLAIDDRPQVLDVWRKFGILTIAVNDPGIPPPIGVFT